MDHITENKPKNKITYKLEKPLCLYANSVKEKLNYYHLNENEINLFFAIIHTINITSINKAIKIDFNTFKKIMNINYRISNENLLTIFENTLSKLDLIKATLSNTENGKRKKQYTAIFTNYGYDETDNTMNYKLNYDLYELFKHLKTEFSILDLNEFTNLKGIYNKKMYEYLNQWNRQTNIDFGERIWKSIYIDKFIEILNLKKGYKLMNIKSQIIEPIINKLRTTYNFSDIEYSLNKEHRKIKRIDFSWTKRKPLINKTEIENYKEIELSEIYKNFDETEQNEIKKTKYLENKYINLKDKINNNKNINDETKQELNKVLDNQYFNFREKQENKANQNFSLKQLDRAIKYKPLFLLLGKKEPNKKGIYKMYNIDNTDTAIKLAKEHYNKINKNLFTDIEKQKFTHSARYYEYEKALAEMKSHYITELITL